MSLPSALEGKWKLDKSDNFDEYLAAKGVPWLVRKMILASSMTRSFKAEDAGFVHTVTTPRFTVEARFPGMGEKSEMKQMDGKMSQVKYEVDGDALVEHIEYADGASDVKRYQVKDGTLVNTFKDDAKGVQCTQYFKKV